MNEPTTATRRPYLRPMTGWWRRDPFFIRYMVREATALAVAAYALVLTVGVVRLSQGEAEWNAWLAALRSPASLAFHLLLLVGMVLHARSWFEIMPKTMPKLRINGEPVAAAAITQTGWVAVVLCTLIVLGLAWWWQP